VKRFFFLTGGIVAALLLIIYASNVNVMSTTAPIPEEPSTQASIQIQPTAEYRSFTIADIAKTGHPQFLDAYATWCPYCQQNEPIIYDLNQQFRDRVDFIYLNVDGEGVLDAAAPYTITGVTQYVLIDSEGKIIQKWFGTLREDEVSDSIASYLEDV